MVHGPSGCAVTRECDVAAAGFDDEETGGAPKDEGALHVGEVGREHCRTLGEYIDHYNTHRLLRTLDQIHPTARSPSRSRTTTSTLEDATGSAA